MIRTIIFDFGNVVGFFDHSVATEKLAAHCALTSAQLLAAMYENPREDDYESGRISTDEFLISIHQEFAFRCHPDEIGTIFGDIFTENPEVAVLVPRLRPKYRVLLGSNTTELHSRHYRRQFAETLGHFDGLVLSHDVGVRKPHRDFFDHCVRTADCAAHECLFIDDLPVNIAGAHAAGLQGIVYTAGVTNLAAELAAHGVEVSQSERIG